MNAAPAVDLDDRQPFPVLGLERRVARDVDLVELEAELGVEVRDHAAGSLTEVTARGVVDDDVRSLGIDAARDRGLGDPLHGEAVRGDAHRHSRFCAVSQVSSNARLTMSFSFALTSFSFQKYSWRPCTHSK